MSVWSLRGLVQRLGGGDGGAEVIDERDTEEMLVGLPLTRAFVERLPRSIVAEAAAENDAKAIEALRLVKRVDELVESHASAARDLREYVLQISAMKASIDKASEHATHLHQQLLDLDALASEVEATQLAAELEELQAAEDLKFETYAQSRRAELAKKKQEYANQLASFERERISVLSEEFSSSITPPRKPVKKTQTGLESVTITSEDAGGELEDFFGGGESSGVSSQPDTVVQKKEKGKTKTAGRRAEVSVRVRRPAKANPHLGVMEDEDIEEGRKWY